MQVTRHNSDPIISARLERSNRKPRNNRQQVSLVAMTSGQLSALDSHIFVIITKLKQQSKRADIDSIHAHIIKTADFENIIKGDLQKRMNSLISDGKVVNKSNRNKDSYWINRDLVYITNESTF